MADFIRYDLLVQDALRGVVRHVLSDVARNGLQGEHHFFITFKTATPGLRLSNRMRERYPDEMTIILQHQFWGLAVTEAGFEVGLSFNNMPERLFVPYAAITMFQDPSVTFGLKFDVKDTGAATDQPAKPSLVEAPKSLPGRRALATVDQNGAGRGASEPGLKQDDKPKAEKAADGSPKSKPVLAKVGDDEAGIAGSGTAASGTKVVSIDSFRKKP